MEGETSLPWHLCFLYFSWNHVCLAYWLKTQFYCSPHCHANKFPKEKAVFYCTPCNINKTDSQIPVPESLLLGIMQHRTYFGECLHKSFSWTLQSCLFMQMALTAEASGQTASASKWEQAVVPTGAVCFRFDQGGCLSCWLMWDRGMRSKGWTEARGAIDHALAVPSIRWNSAVDVDPAEQRGSWGEDKESPPSTGPLRTEGSSVGVARSRERPGARGRGEKQSEEVPAAATDLFPQSWRSWHRGSKTDPNWFITGSYFYSKMSCFHRWFVFNWHQFLCSQAPVFHLWKHSFMMWPTFFFY